MPYGYSRRRRTYRRRHRAGGWMGQASGAISLASRAFKLAKFVASVVNVEYKKNDVAVTSGYQAHSATGSVTLLTGIAQGDTSETRNGNSIRSKSISIKGSLVAGSTTNEARYILFIDKVSSGVAPAITDLLESDGVFARYNDDFAGSRFIILEDKRITMGFNDTTNHYAGGKMNVPFSMFKKLHNHCKYDSTTAGQSDAVSGHVYLYMVATGTGGTHQVNSRYEFIDN